MEVDTPQASQISHRKKQAGRAWGPLGHLSTLSCVGMEQGRVPAQHPSFHLPAPGPDMSPDALKKEVDRLQPELYALHLQRSQGACALDHATFHALTGFPIPDMAWDEYQKAGGDGVFGALKRHSTPIPSEQLEPAKVELLIAFPELKSVMDTAMAPLLASADEDDEPKSHRGAPPVVDHFHLFLLVFMYVHGGVLEFMAPFLPGIGITQEQFSRLLNISTPVVASKWASLYYKQRSLSWLLENAGPNVEKHSSRKTERHLDTDLKNADIVLTIDGGAVPCEKSDGSHEQKAMYDWSKDEQPEVRVIVVGALNGAIVEVSPAHGGRTSEVDVLETMKLLERLNAEAREAGKSVKLHLLVDRGFYFFVTAQDLSEFTFLTVTFGMPHHEKKPKRRGERYTEEEKAQGLNKRRQFTQDETDHNREIAAARWISEWSVGALKHARVFHRLLDLTTLHLIDDFFAIAAALVNYLLEIQPEV